MPTRRQIGEAIKVKQGFWIMVMAATSRWLFETETLVQSVETGLLNRFKVHRLWWEHVQGQLWEKRRNKNEVTYQAKKHDDA